MAERAAAAVALDAGDAAARGRARAGRGGAAEEIGARVEAALARDARRAALAAAGEPERAVDQLDARRRRLRRAAAPFATATPPSASCGRLGRRRHRRTRAGQADGAGIESLTERELQVARLIVDRRTNAQIAAELFLSPKTVETHIRNLFHKLDVSSRVEVARVVERAERAAARVANQGAGSGWRPDVGVRRAPGSSPPSHPRREEGRDGNVSVPAGRLGVRRTAADRAGRSGPRCSAVVIARAAAFGGQTNDKFAVPGTESQQAQELLEEKFPGAGGTYARVVFAAPEGETLTDPENQAAVEATLEQASQGSRRVARSSTRTRPRRSRRTAGSATPTSSTPCRRDEIDDAARDELARQRRAGEEAGLQVEFGGGIVAEEAHARLRDAGHDGRLPRAGDHARLAAGRRACRC